MKKIVYAALLIGLTSTAATAAGMSDNPPPNPLAEAVTTLTNDLNSVAGTLQTDIGVVEGSLTTDIPTFKAYLKKMKDALSFWRVQVKACELNAQFNIGTVSCDPTGLAALEKFTGVPVFPEDAKQMAAKDLEIKVSNWKYPEGSSDFYLAIKLYETLTQEGQIEAALAPEINAIKANVDQYLKIIPGGAIDKTVKALAVLKVEYKNGADAFNALNPQ